MEFRSYLQLARKWLWLLLLGTCIAAASGLAVSLQLTPQYEASITLLVNERGAVTTNYNDLLAGERLAQTDAQLLQQRPVLEQTIQQLKLAFTPEQLVKLLTVKLVPNTQLVQAIVRSPDPNQAAAIANTLGDVFIKQNEARQRGSTRSSSQYLQDQLKSLEGQIAESQKRIAELQAQFTSPNQQAQLAAEQTRLANFQSSYSTVLKNLQDISIADASLSGAVSVVQPAVPPKLPVSPRIPRNVALSGLLGLLVAIGGVLIIETLDDKMHSADRVRDAAGLVTLGRLYTFKGRDKGPQRLATHALEAETYRMLRTNLEFSALDREWRSLLVTSPGPGDGKTTVASSLAVMLAQEGKRVLLADFDLRHPGAHLQFGLENRQGLTNLLVRPDAEPALYLAPTVCEGLFILPTGPLPPNPAELIGSERLSRVLEMLTADFDALVFDSPPLLAVTDPVVLASRTDATLLVVNARRTRARHLRSACDALQTVGAHVLGVALNQVTAGEPDSYQQYYRYYRSDTGHGQNGHDVAATRDWNGLVRQSETSTASGASRLAPPPQESQPR